jgi:Calcineurin-like phosphoesterase
MILATFVHVSDLHFLASSFNVNEVLYWFRFPWLDGLLGHSFTSLERLDRFFGELKKDAKLIVTGDLTTIGKDDQFALAKRYLESRAELPESDFPIGLEAEDWMDYAISGNHDLWPGSINFLRKRKLLAAHAFSFLPKHAVVPTKSADAPPLRFLRINTDAEVSRFKRVFAVGSFVSQLKDLGRELSALDTPKKRDEIRVLCLHHSPSHSGLLSSFIDAESKVKLESFISEHNIAVLLSGHIHQPPLVKICSTAGQVRYLEARCGTTSQIEANSPYIKTKVQELIGRRPATDSQKIPQNSLLLHNLKQEANGDIYWETDIYFREHVGGFKNAGESNNDSIKRRLHKMLVDRRIKVWRLPV